MNIATVLLIAIIITITPIKENKSTELYKVNLLEVAEAIDVLKDILPLEENEIILDYRYIEIDKIEIFSQIGETYYRKFYEIKDNGIEKTSEEVVEMGKGGLKLDEWFM